VCTGIQPPHRDCNHAVNAAWNSACMSHAVQQRNRVPAGPYPPSQRAQPAGRVRLGAARHHGNVQDRREIGLLAGHGARQGGLWAPDRAASGHVATAPDPRCARRGRCAMASEPVPRFLLERATGQPGLRPAERPPDSRTSATVPHLPGCGKQNSRSCRNGCAGRGRPITRPPRPARPSRGQPRSLAANDRSLLVEPRTSTSPPSRCGSATRAPRPPTSTSTPTPRSRRKQSPEPRRSGSSPVDTDPGHAPRLPGRALIMLSGPPPTSRHTGRFRRADGAPQHNQARDIQPVMSIST
jgi:hypothetical protein